MQRKHLVFCVIVLSVFLLVVLAGLIGSIVLLNVGDGDKNNKQFNHLELDSSAELQRYELDSFETACFFYDSQKMTIFTGNEPVVKVVNSDKCYVEVNANKQIHDNIEFKIDKMALSISLKDKLYNEVDKKLMDTNYLGLYIDAPVFELTIYAPLYAFASNTNLQLDFDGSGRADTLMFNFPFEVNGSIHDVNARNLNIQCEGSSRIKLSGKVDQITEVMALHNSKVDAKELNTQVYSAVATNQMFGFSKVEFEDSKVTSFISLGMLSSILLVILPIIFALLIALLIIRIKRGDKITKKVERAMKRMDNMY